MSNQQSTCVYKIHGMHCASCEVLVERKFKKIGGVEAVKVNHANGRAEVYFSQQPTLHQPNLFLYLRPS
jgi:copper chaperone CopZ